MVSWLPHINVTLNILATVLLVAGFVLIKQKRTVAHKRTMLATFAVSTVFLVCYLFYHYNAEMKRFPTDTDIAPLYVRYFYYVLISTHVILAALVPWLAIWSIVLGLRGKIEKHRKVVKWTWPIWLYVSVTGVMVYVMLYQLYDVSGGST